MGSLARTRLIPREPLRHGAPMLSIRGLSKVYRGKAAPAVTNVDLDLRPGEILGLVGLNGFCPE